MTRIYVYDTTLRDGSQGEGVNFSLVDKLAITQEMGARTGAVETLCRAGLRAHSAVPLVVGRLQL